MDTKRCEVRVGYFQDDVYVEIRELANYRSFVPWGRLTIRPNDLEDFSSLLRGVNIEEISAIVIKK